MRFKHLLTLSLCTALLGLAACEPGEVDEAVGTEAGTEAGSATALNTLTEEERAEGWQLLFNGQNFDGWRGYTSETVPAVAWTIEDGVISSTGDTTGVFRDLLTAQTYDNFELSLEYRASECANSGILYNASTETEFSYETGPEFQVADPGCEGESGETMLTRVSGANYDMHGPDEDVSNPAGEWNQARIVVNGNHVEHWLNGVQTVEYELGSDEWQQTVDGSKWIDYPQYGTLPDGHIVLQDHGTEVSYRNIKIRPLDGAEAAPAS